MRLTKLMLDQIRTDGGTQPRVVIDNPLVAEYAAEMAEGAAFPPVEVYVDGADYWLADGFHRVHAAHKNGDTVIAALVRPGTRDDAQWASLAANKAHGLRRTNADKTKAVKTALKARPQLSNRQVAEHVGVSEGMVRTHRADLTAQVTQSDRQSTAQVTQSNGQSTAPKAQSDERVGADGRTTNTANIGKARTYFDDDEKTPESDNSEFDNIPFDMPAPATGCKPVPPTDRTGKPLPTNCDQVEGIAEAFRRQGEITTIMTDLSRIKGQVERMVEAGDPLVANLTLTQFQADCNNARRAIKAQRPYATCPYCAGDGCKACCMRGWVGQFVYNAAPREMKG